MRVHFVFVGKTGFSDLESAIGRYTERLGHYCPMHVHYVKAEKISSSTGENAVREREGERVLKLVNPRGHMVVMDQTGVELDSKGLAVFLQKMMDSGVPDLWMVVGGPVGVSEDLRKKAETVISLSRMTLPHDLARLVLVEQVYRAFTIMRGEPYHK